MKKLFLSSAIVMMATAASAATASFSNGKLTLDFIGDWAIVEGRSNNITIVDGEGIQLASVIGEADYDFSNTYDYQVLTYNVSGRLDAGDYTVKVADGAIYGHKTDPWSFDLTSIGALELPLTVTDDGGEPGDDQTANLKEPTFALIDGSGINVKYTYSNSYEPDGFNKSAATGKMATLTEDGTEVATAEFGFLMEPTFFYGVHFDYTEVEGKTYVVTFPAGCWYVEKIDEMTGNSEVVLESEQVSYTWIGGEDSGTTVDPSDQPGTGGSDDNDDPVDPQSPVTVNFLVSNPCAAITNNMLIADITVDRAYYDIYWTITCANDPEFFHGGSSHAASEGAGTYTIIASTPSSEPIVLNGGNVYTFTFQTCEFGWDGYTTAATFEVTGSGAAAEQFSDIEITDFDGTLGALGYNFKNQYTVTFSAPVNNVKAYAPLGLDGVQNFGVTAADNDGLKWTIDVSSMANEEGAFELHITAVDAATGLRLNGTYHLDHSFIYTISISTSDPGENPGDDPELPGEELDIASITINGVVYKLSENEAISLESYPEGSVFTITLADEAIKKVSYEIVDATAGEVLKSIADLEKGDEGVWTAVMPKTYELAAGHEFHVHVIARDGMSSFTSQVLYEYNFLVLGTANVAVYSNVKVADITPGTNEVITDETPVITITFTEAVASVTAKAITGQMMSMKVPAENITTADNISWDIAVPAGAIVSGNLQLDIVATDYEGNRVTDAENGVGSPATCYLSYSWLSTVDLPTPKMTESGTTVQSLAEVHFTYDGIGLNDDMATATWQQISVTRDGVALDLQVEASMFTTAGDPSVGATELILTFPAPFTISGTYTISVPAFAFMLGHDQNNNYNGACQFKVTVDAPNGIANIEAAGQSSIYRLDGTKADSLVSGSLIILNGQKVIVK